MLLETLTGAAVTATVAYFLKLAGKGAEAAAEKTGEGIVELLKKKFMRTSEQAALEELRTDPEDASSRAMLETALKQRLASDDAFKEELTALLGNAAGDGGQTAVQVGDKNKIVQIKGSNNKTTL